MSEENMDMDEEAEGEPPTSTITTTTTTNIRATMTPDEEAERRAAIREIMNDSSLSALEKRRQIQSLMDGRRRSSGSAKSTGAADVAGNMSMMAQAAAAAAEFYDSDSDDYMLGIHDTDDEQDGENNEDADDEGSRPPSRAGSVGSLRGSFQRLGRSASLKNFAAGAAAAAAAAAAALEASDNPADRVNHARRMEKSRPDCDHYERQCTIISPCCGLAFGCRICHDESPVLPPPKPDPTHWADDFDMHREQQGRTLKRRRSLPTNFDEAEEALETHHQIDRFAIAQVICRKCFTLQSSKTDNCVQCGISFGEYHCNVCNLWMGSEDHPYHCQDCGFCRVGGRENFKHCDDCGMCIDAQVFNDHDCKAGKYMSDCPVCQEDLFSSRSASHEMNCGHAIHWECYQELITYDSRCPVCKKTAESPETMAATWSAMAMGIALQPVPPEMSRVVNIICNDCEERSRDRRWHFLGVQCLKCLSFNTTVEQTTHMGREAAEFLGDDVQAAQRTAGDDTEAMQESISSFTDTNQLTADQQRNIHAHLVSMAGAPIQQRPVLSTERQESDGSWSMDDDESDENL